MLVAGQDFPRVGQGLVVQAEFVLKQLSMKKLRAARASAEPGEDLRVPLRY